MKWFHNVLGLLALASVVTTSSAKDDIAEVLSSFSFTSTLLTVATLDDPFLAPIAAAATGEDDISEFYFGNSSLDSSIEDQCPCAIHQNIDFMVSYE